ncbi:MAG: TIGR02147 family protein [Bdellovibrionales bacterium]
MVNRTSTSSAVAASPPQILLYKDYRNFLSDYYQFKKALRAGFSFRRFAQMAGIASPNYLQLVMQGKRNLSPDMAARVAKALGLTAPERQFFVALVGIDRAKSEEARIRAQTELLRSVKSLIAKEIPKAQVCVLTEWYHLIVRELVVLADFKASGDWISEKMRGWITPVEAERSLLFLQKAGFLKSDGGQWIQSDPVIDTGNAFDEAVGMRFYEGTLSAWSKMLPHTDKNLRELCVLNIPMTAEKIPELKKRLRDFQDELIGWLQDEKDPERVVQLGFFLVPTTK